MQKSLEFDCLINDKPANLNCNEHTIFIKIYTEEVKLHISLNLHIKWNYRNKVLEQCQIENYTLQSSSINLSRLKDQLNSCVMYLGATEIYEELQIMLKTDLKANVIVKSAITGEKFFCKTYLKQNEYQLIQEVRILRKLKNCKNVVAIKEVYESPKYFYIILECLDRKLEQDYTHEENQIVIQEILTILDTLQQNNIVHGQIRPENFMFDSNHQLKLIGFSKAKIEEQPNTTDLFRLHKVMLYLYNFDIKSINIDQGIYPLIPGHGTNFLKSLMNNTQYRINIKQALTHPYIKCNETDHQIVQEQLIPKFKQNFSFIQ